ncbi:MAG: TRAP transporter substrate-binding protein [Geminicoccales bacterium]
MAGGAAPIASIVMSSIQGRIGMTVTNPVQRGTRLFLAALCAIVVGGTAHAADTIPMKLATATVNDVQVEAIKVFAENLEKRSNGRIEAQLFPGAQLGSNPRMIEGLQLGTIEVYVGPPAYLVGIDERFQVLDTPGIFSDMDHAWRTIRDPAFRDKFLALGKDKGLIGVSLFIYSPTSYATREPLRAIEDFKGRKLRVLASEMERAATNALGATAVPIDFSEVVPALERGTIDGMKSGLSAFTAIKVYDVVKFATLTHEAIIPEVMMVSRSWFERQPPDIQKMILEEGRAIEPGLHEYTKQAQIDAREIWREHGGELIELSDKDRSEMMARLAKVADEVFASKPKVAELYELMTRIADKHRSD